MTTKARPLLFLALVLAVTTGGVDGQECCFFYDVFASGGTGLDSNCPDPCVNCGNPNVPGCEPPPNPEVGGECEKSCFDPCGSVEPLGSHVICSNDPHSCCSSSNPSTVTMTFEDACNAIELIVPSGKAYCPAQNTCPASQPSPGSSCNSPGLECRYGEEVCCGRVHDAVVATCDAFTGDWLIANTNACLGGCSGDVDMDPHFRDWQGQFWDFHGICDMMFLSSRTFGNGKGLRIHIRTKGRYNYSFIQSAVVMIGEDLLEVSGFGDYTVNGIASANLNDVLLGGLYKVEHNNPNKSKHSFTISKDDDNQESIIVTTFKDMTGIHLRGAMYDSFGDSVGLMGNYTTAMKLARDGTTVMDGNDPVAFGQEWQVLDSEPMLFQTLREPQHPVPCVIPTPAKAEVARRRLGQAAVSKEQAEKACAHWDDTYKAFCVMDVLAMQDLEAAEAGPGAY